MVANHRNHYFMKQPLTRLLAIAAIVLCLFPLSVSAQRMQEALNNPVIMHYYTAEQLQEIAAADTNELNAIVFYFTESFRVDSVECFDCVQSDLSMFDITKFEHLRQQDSVYTREFTKYGFTLTIYPVSALPYEYAIHQVPLFGPGENPQQH